MENEILSRIRPRAENEPIDEKPIYDFERAKLVLRACGDMFMESSDVYAILHAINCHEAYLRTLPILKELTAALEHFCSAEFHLREVSKKLVKYEKFLKEHK